MEVKTYTHIKQRKKRDRVKEICVWLLAIKFHGLALERVEDKRRVKNDKRRNK